MDQLRDYYEHVIGQDYDWNDYRDRLHVLTEIRRNQLSLETDHLHDLVCLRDGLEDLYSELEAAVADFDS